MAVWSLKRRIVIPLILFILGHWALVTYSTFNLVVSYCDKNKISNLIFTTDTVSASFWTDTSLSKPGSSVNVRLLLVMFIYTTAFDTVIFFVTAWKLVFPRTPHTRLVDRILRDGLTYFALM